MKKTSKKTKIIIPALATLLLTSVASVSSTVAWFMANTSTTVSGMSFKAQAGSNLMIADTEGKTTTLATSWSTSLTQTFNNVSLQPVSSVDGKSFFYMSSGATNGLGVADSTATFSAATATEYGATSSYSSATDAYVLDYVFQLKATNPNSSDQTVAITTLNLTSPLTASNNSEKAFRVATFVENAGTTSGSEFTNGLPTSPAQSAIYAPSDAEYNTSGKAISSIDDNGSATYGDVTIANTANTIGTVSKATNSATTAYFKVWVRLWLEGEDKSCYNDLFLSSGNWSLNLEVQMGDTTGVSALGVSYTTAQSTTSSSSNEEE